LVENWPLVAAVRHGFRLLSVGGVAVHELHGL
jgi:hypothetical protein